MHTQKIQTNCKHNYVFWGTDEKVKTKNLHHYIIYIKKPNIIYIATKYLYSNLKRILNKIKFSKKVTLFLKTYNYNAISLYNYVLSLQLFNKIKNNILITKIFLNLVNVDLHMGDKILNGLFEIIQHQNKYSLALTNLYFSEYVPAVCDFGINLHYILPSIYENNQINLCCAIDLEQEDAVEHFYNKNKNFEWGDKKRQILDILLGVKKKIVKIAFFDYYYSSIINVDNAIYTNILNKIKNKNLNFDKYCISNDNKLDAATITKYAINYDINGASVKSVILLKRNN